MIFHTLVFPPDNVTLFMLLYLCIQMETDIVTWSDITFFWNICTFWEANVIIGMNIMCTHTSDATITKPTNWDW